jgi:phage portal protein BeeE
MLSIEQTLSLFLPNGTEVKFDTSELLKEDTKGRYENYAVALSAGFLTKDEVRALENLEPLPDEPTESPVEPLPIPSADEATDAN